MGQLKKEKDRSNVRQCVLMGQLKESEVWSNVIQCFFFYEPAMTTTKLPLVIKVFELN